MKLWIFGGSGMLGRHVVAVAKERGYDVFDPTSEACSIDRLDHVGRLWATAKSDIPNSVGLPDVIINCAGALPGANSQRLILTNGLGPHNLASLGIRMVHMSTDCVFSGESIRDDTFQRPLETDSAADPLDLYGRSKLLGEPMHDHVLVVRGSFIDPAGGFLHWLLNARRSVDAWMNAYWNGTSARRMAEHLVELAETDHVGIHHVASPTSVTKAWMVRKFVEELDLRLDLKMVKEPDIWRVLEPDIETIPVEQMCDELIAEIKEVNGELSST